MAPFLASCSLGEKGMQCPAAALAHWFSCVSLMESSRASKPAEPRPQEGRAQGLSVHHWESRSMKPFLPVLGFCTTVFNLLRTQHHEKVTDLEHTLCLRMTSHGCKVPFPNLHFGCSSNASSITLSSLAATESVAFDIISGAHSHRFSAV